MVTINQIDDIYEADGDELGGWMGVLIDGHVDDESAVALAWAYMSDCGYDYSLAHPRCCWVRKIPRGGYIGYHYVNAPARGARACTVVETSAVNPWRHWCDVPRCRWRFVPGSAKTGVPRANIANGDELGIQAQRRPGEYVYLCYDHYTRYEQDLRAARKAALDRYYAERAAS